MTLEEFLAQWNDASPCMEVKTSGSTGVPKHIYIEKERMRASARMTCDFLGLRQGDTALLCMPLDYIAGKMMVIRALERGLKLLSVEPSSHPLCSTNMESIGNPSCIDFAAMVPLQVWNTLQVPEEREAMCRIRHLIIGGGAISQALEQELRTLSINVWSSYGMTETLSHIALRRITEDCYTPLPGITLCQDQDGCLIIDAPHLCSEALYTNDIVEIRHQAEALYDIRYCRNDIVGCNSKLNALCVQTLDGIQNTVKEFYHIKAYTSIYKIIGVGKSIYYFRVCFARQQRDALLGCTTHITLNNALIKRKALLLTHLLSTVDNTPERVGNSAVKVEHNELYLTHILLRYIYKLFTVGVKDTRL